MDFFLPRDVCLVIERFYNSGYKCHIVGGSVRDILMGKKPDDYDMTTDADPKTVKALFCDCKTVDTGIKHGTVTVIYGTRPIEITTYRTESGYRDNRHPDRVIFTKSLESDLARRDFTVNAMAYNHFDGLVDIFGGREDLKKGCIRSVGDGRVRFSEDGLRILRAIRFSSVLNFEIEKNTEQAIFSLKNLLFNISAERVMSEWTKIVKGIGACRVITRYSEVLSPLLGLENITLPKEEDFLSLPPHLRELAVFFMNSTEPREAFANAMRKLRSDKKRLVFGCGVLDAVKLKTDTREDVLNLLIDFGEDIALCALKLKALTDSDALSHINLVDDILKRSVCHKISMLSVSGTDLKKIGISERSIGWALDKLVRCVCIEGLENSKESLISKAKELKFSENKNG